jgi:septation ring formation regulator EzrA
MERKVIRLSPRQEIDADAIALGLSYAYRIGPKYRKMKLSKKEMLFLTLLHEIAHFRIGERVPRFYHKLRRELEARGEVSREEIPIIEKYIRRRREESEESWKLRIADFESWLVLDETITHHMKVENWAIEEFEKRRPWIREELQKSGLDFHD